MYIIFLNGKFSNYSICIYTSINSLLQKEAIESYVIAFHQHFPNFSKFTFSKVTFSKFNLIEKTEFYIYVEGASFNWEIWNIS